MADIRRVDVGSRLRRAAGASLALGLTLLVSSTVALAQDPTPEPTPTPVPTVTVVPTPAATVVVSPTPTASAALTPEPSATVAASPSSSPSPSPTPTATATATATPGTPARQATPTPTPTATTGTGGAQLTLCHALGDGTYETVTITIEDDTLNEHFDHDDDIIPAPATGCGPGAQPDDVVGVCHATGDPSQPYVFGGFLPPDELGVHAQHPGDLIPAPNGTCPGLTEYFVPTPVPTEEPTAEPTVTAVPTAAETATPTPTAEIIDEVDGGDGDPSPPGAVAGTTSPGATATYSATYLPFTGLELQLIALAGLGLVLTGLGLRLLSQGNQPPVGVTL